ncbi:LysR family transcriptional regulator [Teredinibacter sp. KSP-S5-2]|uniref:LysR family transcriptional regulator n=1 Tax=Teredinibacter sp. KSP-S5-2 TaxID=3034506 RepID=UPI002934BB18|nr:LysR family transcriptional regulator [Teredinibacter sp. KSP-S5-2]WNO11509.1 LysR family transcriptional regulator [Teredinibacter sp. KSP-S5-2]
MANSRLHSHIGTFRQMELLVTVYDTGSINKAAEKLHLTQPTISMQLKKMADAIGMPLYNKVGRKLVFTDAGLILVQSAREILDSFSRLDMKLADLRGFKSGTLKISVVTTSKYFIPHLLGPFCKRYPNVDIQLKIGNREQIIERLRSSLDDFCVFSHAPQNMDICTLDFLPNPLVAIASEQHPLASQEKITLAELEKYPFIMREQGSGTRNLIENFMKEHKISLNARMTIDSNEAIKHSVAEDLGISILSKHTLAFDEIAGIKHLEVEGMPIQCRWQLVYPSNKRLSVIAEAFLSYLNQGEGLDSLKARIGDMS